MRVAKSGRSTCYKEATVQDVNATVKVYGYPTSEEYAIFSDQIITGYLGAPGDSGSIVVNVDTKKAVGLLFAGSDTVTCLNKITNVCRLLNISFTPIAIPPAWSYAAIALGMIPLAFSLTIVGYSEFMKYLPKVR